MSGLREALEYVVESSKPEVIEIGGQTYSDKRMNRISYQPIAHAIQVSTLTGFVDYLKKLKKDLDFSDKVIVHIESPTEVRAMSSLNSERIRETYVEARANIPRSKMDAYVEKEEFCIWMQTGFTGGDTDKELILKFAGTVETGTIAQYSDDGVSQKASVKMGIASKADAIVPNPVQLRPYRTFSEVEQPLSKFIFRMRENRGVECALYGADGGAWKTDAMENIRKYLAKELDKEENIVIIC